MNLIFALAIVVIWAMALIGWAINLVEAVTLIIHSAPFTTLLVVRVVGVVVAPIGAILGWF